MALIGAIPSHSINATNHRFRGTIHPISSTITPSGLREIMCLKKKVMIIDPKKKDPNPWKHWSNCSYMHANIKLAHATCIASNTHSYSLI